MDSLTFKNHFDKSLKLLLSITRKECHNSISENFIFLVEPSGRDAYEELDTVEKSNLLTINKYADKQLTADEVSNLLSKTDKVPLWINMTVYEATSNLTVIHLLCSRRLRSENNLFKDAVLYPPFNPMILIPPDPLRNEIDGKFDINWKSVLAKTKKRRTLFSRLMKIFSRQQDKYSNQHGAC